MPDTLAPKKTMTQRELDNKLTPIAEKVKEGPLVTGEIVKDYLFKPLPLLQDERISVKTKEQQQTQASAKEGLVKRPEVEDTGDIENVSTVQQGEVKPTLAARPVMYAADGMDNKEINNPIVVGEKGPEMLVPTGNGRFSILPNDVVNGLMEKTKTSTPELSSTVSMKDTSTGFMTDEQKEDVVYLSDNPNITGTVAQITGVGTLYTQALIKRKFNNEIVPTLKGKTLDLPKNIAGDDISGSLRDAYQHGYISGFTNLRDGTLQSEIMAQGREVPIYSLFRKLDQAEAKDNTMDINNNKVGFAVANEVREELGYKGKTIPSNKIKEAEMLFNLRFNERYLDEIALYAAGKGKKYSDKVSKFDQYAQAFSREKPDRMILEFSPEYIEKEKAKLNK